MSDAAEYLDDVVAAAKHNHLDDETVRAIYWDPRSYAEISKTFNCGKTAISRIKTGKGYPWVERGTPPVANVKGRGTEIRQKG